MSNVDLKKSKNPTIFLGLLIFTSLAYVVALSWNTFFEKVAEKYIGDQYTILGYFGYAAILTIVLVMSSYFVIKFYPKLFS